MARKNAAKVAVRARQAKLGKCHFHLGHVQTQKVGGPRKRQGREATLCAPCAPMYGYEPVLAEGISLGGQCFGCDGQHEILGMFTVPHPTGGFPSQPLTEADLKKRRIVDEEDSFGAFNWY